MAQDTPRIPAPGAAPAFRLPAAASYWLPAAGLGAIQFAFTLHSRTQLRYEEAAESIRNVYWLDWGGNL